MDRLGLVALWREALLAKAVIYGRTKGYRRHPQLERFYRSRDPRLAIGSYLFYVAEEARGRGYSFDLSKVELREEPARRMIPVTRGQLGYEALILRCKLMERSPADLWRVEGGGEVELEENPLFFRVEGGAEGWERAKEDPCAGRDIFRKI